MYRSSYKRKGFTLIELLVVIAIVALLSALVLAAMSTARQKGRDGNRIATARTLRTALALYEDKYGSVSNLYTGNMMATSSGSTTIDTLVSEGFLSRKVASDSVFGNSEYYLGICSDGSYNVYAKLEQSAQAQSSSTLSGLCGGSLALTAGYNYSSGAGGGAGSSGAVASGSGSSGVAATGALDAAFATGAGANTSVYATVIQGDGKIIVGGNFTAYDSIARGYVARLNTDGTLDAAFATGAGGNAVVYSAAIQSDGKIIIGGNFTNYNGIARGYIARLNTDGTLDATFATGVGANAAVRSIAVQTDGKIIIGGNFTAYNGTSRGYVARLNTDGTLDTTFATGAGASGVVLAVGIQTDGKVIIGGLLSTYDGTARGRIARLNTDGTLDTTFATGAGANSNVYTFAIQSDGKMIITGLFATYDGTARAKIARINSDGSLDTTFAPGTGTNGPASAVVIQSDGKIIIGGTIATYNGTARGNIARVNTDGTLDTTFATGAGANNIVRSVALQADGKVVIDGDFITYDGVSRGYIARLQ